MRDVVTGLARRLGLGDAPRPGLIGEWPGPGETPALTGIVALPLRVGPAPDGRGLSAERPRGWPAEVGVCVAQSGKLAEPMHAHAAPTRN